MKVIEFFGAENSQYWTFLGVQDCADNDDETVDCPVSQVPTPVSHDNLAGGEMGILNYKLYNEINWTLPDWFDAYTLSQFEDLHDLFPFTLMSRDMVEKVGQFITVKVSQSSENYWAKIIPGNLASLT